MLELNGILKNLVNQFNVLEEETEDKKRHKKSLSCHND